MALGGFPLAQRPPFPVLLLAVVLLGVPSGLVAAGDPAHEDPGLFRALTVHHDPKIDVVVAPTNGAPSFVAWGEEFRVELTTLPVASSPTVTLSPSFGDGPSVTLVSPAVLGPEPSALWEGPYARSVFALSVTIPSGTPPGLYDVTAEGDTQRRAVRVYETYPETLRLVLVADPQTGDPRAIDDGLKESTGVSAFEPHKSAPGPEHVPPDPGPLNTGVDETLGIDILHVEIEPGERWAPYRRAIAQINALAPDAVLFSGDLGFGQLVPASYHAEYEDAYALINGGAGIDGTLFAGIEAPTLLAPGNHDGYVANGEDGFALWVRTFGPPAFRTTLGDVTFLALNTYDWSEMDRLGASYAVSAWGGQVRGEQLAWVRTALCEANGGTPLAEATAPAGVGCFGAGDTRVLAFAHHSPSWVQDRFQDEFGGAYETCPCEGTPVLEQVARGATSFPTTGQAWSGENRLVLRDTLSEFGVDLFAAGHTHRDRIARELPSGDVLEVPQDEREGLDPQKLHVVTRDGLASEHPDQAAAMALMRSLDGPIYVDTTTAGSDTSLYWGYRPVTWHASEAAFPVDALGIPPFEMGFPMTRALLDEIAHHPERWNETHAAFGLYSTPTDGSPP